MENAARVGEVLGNEIEGLKKDFSDVIGAVHGRGLVYGMHIIKKDSLEPDGELAFRIVEQAIRKGLMLFAPVGFGGATIKICPPLVIDKDAVEDGIEALRESIKDAI